jgi:hypothetical protein
VVLSKREKYIGIGASIAVGLLILNSVILDPLLAQQSDLETKIVTAKADKKADDDLMDQAGRASVRWIAMLTPKGTMLKDESLATSQLYNNISEWSRDAGLNPPPALKSDRGAEKVKDFQQISVHASITGTMSQVSRFVWDVQNSNVPVRITELQVSSRKSGSDDLKVEMDIATVYFSPTLPTGTPDSGGSNAPASPTASTAWERRP